MLSRLYMTLQRYSFQHVYSNDKADVRVWNVWVISMLLPPTGADIKQVEERALLPTWLRWGGAVIGHECHVWEINGVAEASREAWRADSSAMEIYSLCLCLCLWEHSSPSPLWIWQMQHVMYANVNICVLVRCMLFISHEVTKDFWCI